MTIKIEVDDAEVKRVFAKLIASVEAGELSMAGAEVVYDLSQNDVPVDTGELRDSGEVIQKGDETIVIYTAEHAVPIEFGTSKMAAQPYLRPAIDKHSKIQSKMAKKFKSQIGA